MFPEKALLYFKKFYFENGSSKEKFFIVLRNIDSQSILASLPSSISKNPSAYDGYMGCLELDEVNHTCYILSKDKDITDQHFKFKLTTYLYGYGLQLHRVDELKNTYPLEGINYDFLGLINDEIFDDIILCFKSSRVVKRKFKRYL